METLERGDPLALPGQGVVLPLCCNLSGGGEQRHPLLAPAATPSPSRRMATRQLLSQPHPCTRSLSVPGRGGCAQGPPEKSLFCCSAVPRSRECYFSKPRGPARPAGVYFSNRLVARSSRPSPLPPLGAFPRAPMVVTAVSRVDAAGCVTQTPVRPVCLRVPDSSAWESVCGVLSRGQCCPRGLCFLKSCV